jgi:vacuolar protein sorting-associated protein 51
MATITSPRPDPVQRMTSPSIPSASGTPTSSVRPSLELPRSNNPTSPIPQQNTAPGAATAQRRNRAALRDYYNLKSKAPSAAGGPEQRNVSRTTSITSIASDSTVTSSAAIGEAPSSLTTQLDDPNFDASAYVAETLKTAGLRDILKIESALVSEVRTLDGERKALVYDNYSKLIKAVGTIAEMQKGMHKDIEQDRFASALGKKREQPVGLDGVKEVGQKLEELLTLMKELSPRESAEKTSDSAAREQTRQKETVRWALAAPQRLQQLLDEGQREKAEHLCTTVLELTANWKGVGGAEELRQHCQKILRCDEKTNDKEIKDSDDDEEEDTTAD